MKKLLDSLYSKYDNAYWIKNWILVCLGVGVLFLLAYLEASENAFDLFALLFAITVVFRVIFAPGAKGEYIKKLITALSNFENLDEEEKHLYAEVFEEVRKNKEINKEIIKKINHVEKVTKTHQDDLLDKKYESWKTINENA